MEVWAHTLFKNEERWLWFSVNSIINHVDKLLLWDTGSTDSSWKIAKLLKSIYKDKINLRQLGEVTTETFTKARQEMLNQTESDWFLVVDADEIWWDGSIRDLLSAINETDDDTESFVVPTLNLVGDIFHYQEERAGRYTFGKVRGHYNLRAVKRTIPGLHSEGEHGVWGWADKSGKQIQDRNTFKFINAQYLHATFLQRGAVRNDDAKVPKRSKKYKYEFGNPLSLDFFYPEILFVPRPNFVPSPWKNVNLNYKLRAFLQTPLRKIKRRIIYGRPGY